MEEPIRTGSGRRLDELTIEALRAGRLAPEDFRISKAQLDRQAAAAEAAGYRQMAENLRRAAELTRFPTNACSRSTPCCARAAPPWPNCALQSVR